MLTLLVLPLLALSVVVGTAHVRHRQRRTGSKWLASGLEGNLIGVYGLLLSFGFYSSGEVNRANASLVHDQSEVLAMLYREGELLPAGDRATVTAAVRGLLELKVRIARAGDEERAALELECGRAYDGLWAVLRERAGSGASSVDYRPTLDLLQRAIALEYRQRFSETERMPGAFLVLLFAGGLLIGYLIGFTSSGAGHGKLVPIIFVVLAGCTLIAIVDLNDPWHGFLRPSHANYEQLLGAIRG